MRLSDKFNKIKSLILKDKKSRLIFAAAVAAVVIIIASAAAFGGRHTGAEIALYYSPAEKGAVICNGKDRADGVISGRSVAAVKYSGDRSSAAVLMSEGSYYTLFVASDGKIQEISSDCTNNFAISYSGDVAIYLDTSGKMRCYNVKRRKNTDIDENITSFAVSPNGKTIIYGKNENGAENLYLYSDSFKGLISQNYTPLAVSDDCRYIYALTADNSLCLIGTDGMMKSKLCSGIEADALYFSRDMTGVVFCDGAYTYASYEGKSKIRLVPGKGEPVSETKNRFFCNSDNTAMICDVKDFSDMYYSVREENADNSLFFITGDNRRLDVATSVRDCIVVKNKRIICMTSDGKVYSCKKGAAELLFEGALAIAATSDGRYVYYFTKPSELNVYHNGKIKKLASGMRDIYITPWDELLFLLSDLRLYSVSKMKDAVLLDENVYSCYVNGNTVFYIKDYNSNTGVFDLYSADRKNGFKLAGQGLSRIM